MVIGLVLATGGHWAALQSVAWVGMTIKYSRHETLASALRKTFDGNNPCDLCKVVREGREAEQKQVAFNLQAKIDLFLAALNSSVEGPVFVNEPTPQLFSGRSRPESPPTPPPRPV